MGAAEFMSWGKGTTPQKAFDSAREAALFEYGHGGYTGTIAEKQGFSVLATVNTRKEAVTMANELLDSDDPRVDDKWGPAGCIVVRGTEYCLFFGWASL